MPERSFVGLKAIFINCTLKKSPCLSHTAGLMKVSEEIMRREGVATELIRAVDYDLPPGVQPDMREHGWARDDWPELIEKILAAFMTYNLLHLARMLKKQGGYPTYGNQRSAWDQGTRWAFDNPEYR